MADICVRCQKKIGLFKKPSARGRCADCEKTVQEALGYFRLAFLNACADGLLEQAEWTRLANATQKAGVELQEALNFIRGDALNFVERSIAFAASDGEISNDEENYLRSIIAALGIPHTQAAAAIARIGHIQFVSRLRRGELPSIESSARLEAGEVCHLETPATYFKVTAKGAKPHDGRIVATSKCMHFVSPTGGFVVNWTNVLRTAHDPRGVYIELTKKAGNGLYGVQDPEVAEATITTLVRLAKREIIKPGDDPRTRHIPQDVKLGVWQRDQGKCIQCSAAEYLEFDHIIPHSKGGANTVGNVQLLCRKCNLSKSDRI